jgi:hypothetical protein
LKERDQGGAPSRFSARGPPRGAPPALSSDTGRRSSCRNAR